MCMVQACDMQTERKGGLREGGREGEMNRESLLFLCFVKEGIKAISEILLCLLTGTGLSAP